MPLLSLIQPREATEPVKEKAVSMALKIMLTALPICPIIKTVL